MKKVLLELDDDQLADIDAAVESAGGAWRTLANMVTRDQHSPAKTYIGYLLLNTDKTAHKVNALIGVGIVFANLLGKRDRESRTQLVATVRAGNMRPDLIAPAPNCRLNGMPIDEFLDLIRDEEPPDAVEEGRADD